MVEVLLWRVRVRRGTWWMASQAPPLALRATAATVRAQAVRRGRTAGGGKRRAMRLRTPPVLAAGPVPPLRLGRVLSSMRVGGRRARTSGWQELMR